MSGPPLFPFGLEKSMATYLRFEEGTDIPDSLAHFGVKGMHWGVWNEETRRRHMGGGKREAKSDISGSSQNENGKKGLTRNQKIAIGVAAAGVALAAIGGYGLYKATQPSSGYKVLSGDKIADSLDKFDDVPVSIRKGASLSRVSPNKVDDLKEKGELYVSYKLRDKAKYVDRMPGESWLRYRDSYKQTLKTSKPIKAPSEREAAKIFASVAGKDSTVADYQRFMSDGIRKKNQNPHREAFVSKVKEMGYNALIDSNDTGWTKKPLVLLDPDGSISKQRGRRITMADRVIANYLK